MANRVDSEGRFARAAWLAMPLLLIIGAVVFSLGITWGLPSRAVDPFLFGDREPWSGEKILQLAGGWHDDPARGADVDVDPLAAATQPVVLNETDAQRARIILRYRLYTYQPDEMITMRALASMRPGEGQLDPRLYQYGGLWIYPVGALLKLASLAGLITLRPDVAWYLDHPEEFGRFYVVARAYSAAWGLLGLWAVFWITRRLTGGAILPTVFAGLCYIAMPVVINMAHEAKPHLPGAALQLLAIAAAMKYVGTRRARWWLLTAALCGAAFGMVLSAWPIFVVLPVAEWLRWRRTSRKQRTADPGRSTDLSRDGEGAGVSRDPAAQPLPYGRGSDAPAPASSFAKAKTAVVRIIGGSFVGFGVYLATNPYIVINLFKNPEVLRSNFGNSLAMYEIGRWPEGLANAARLVAEGASWALAVTGAIAASAALAHVLIRRVSGGRASRPPLSGDAQPHQPELASAWLLAAPSLLILIQFIALAAGKPGEYGRFAVLPDTVMAIAAVTGLWMLSKSPWVRLLAYTLLLAFEAYPGLLYLAAFLHDSTSRPWRLAVAPAIAHLKLEEAKTIAVAAEPAPYSMPPLDVFHYRIFLLPQAHSFTPGDTDLFIRVVDEVPHQANVPSEYEWIMPRWFMPSREISWADKPVLIWRLRWWRMDQPARLSTVPADQSF